MERGFDFYDKLSLLFQPSKFALGGLARRGRIGRDHAEKNGKAHSSGPTVVWIHFYDAARPILLPPPFSHLTQKRLLYALEKWLKRLLCWQFYALT